ncbi:MAG TPA: PH domain-containing protein [Nitrososphaeraceae archaeon]|nr:PH domain-containing protein [Nitrososphaeraceae archaeon]
MPFGSGSNKEEEEEKYTLYIEKPVIKGNDLEEVNKIREMLNPDEKVLLVARQSKIKPGGSYFTPNTIYATDRRIIIRDPYMLGIKANVVDIPYDIITSLKLEKGLLSSTIRFKAAGLMSSTKLGMMDSVIEGEDDQSGIIEAIPKDKAEDLIEIIRSGMQDSRRIAPSKKQKSPEPDDHKEAITTSNQSGSIADELQKLANLKNEGVLTEEEFNQMKKDLIRNNKR